MYTLKTNFKIIGLRETWLNEQNKADAKIKYRIAVNPETKMSSFWQTFHHCLHLKLSFWQLPVQPVMKISSKWRQFRFNIYIRVAIPRLAEKASLFIHESMDFKSRNDLYVINENIESYFVEIPKEIVSMNVGVSGCIIRHYHKYI